MRVIPSIWDEEMNLGVSVQALVNTIQDDIDNGLTPFFLGLTIGTTRFISTDPVGEIVAAFKAKG